MIRFDKDAFYDEDALRLLGLDSGALAQARRNGGLRCRQIGRVRLYKGEWLQEWLSGPQGPGGTGPQPGTAPRGPR